MVVKRPGLIDTMVYVGSMVVDLHIGIYATVYISVYEALRYKQCKQYKHKKIF